MSYILKLPFLWLKIKIQLTSTGLVKLVSKVELRSVPNIAVVDSHSLMELSLHFGKSVLIVDVLGPAGVVLAGGVL